MKKLTLAVLFSAALASATPVAQVKLLNAGRPVLRDHSRFVGPYTLALNGRKVYALCLDLEDPTDPGDQWPAYISTLNAGLGHTYHPAAFVRYREEAYLLSKIVGRASDRLSIQEAAWAIFDPAFRPDTQAEYWIAQAERGYGALNLAGFAIVSGVSQRPGCRPQEFVTELPEPPQEMLLGGLLLVVLAGWGLRSRAARDGRSADNRD